MGQLAAAVAKKMLEWEWVAAASMCHSAEGNQMSFVLLGLGGNVT